MRKINKWILSFQKLGICLHILLSNNFR
jgi:hypothetical protein